MNITSRLAVAGLAALSIVTVASTAEARPRRQGPQLEGRSVYLTPAERAITVTRRSWLDSGNVVPVRQHQRLRAGNHSFRAAAAGQYLAWNPVASGSGPERADLLRRARAHSAITRL